MKRTARTLFHRAMPGISLLLLTCASPAAPTESQSQDNAPLTGTPEKEYSRRIAKEWDPLPSKVIGNLRGLAARSQDSAELLLRQGYHLLNASIVGKEWDEVWPHLKDPELFDVEMWSARQVNWYFYRFGIQRKAWTSPGGIPHDLLLGLTVAHEVVKGQRTRRSVQAAQALLRAHVKAPLADLRQNPRYARGSVFQVVLQTPPSPPSDGPLPYVASVEANYEPFRDRWSEIWTYQVHFKVEFVDALEAPVRTWDQTFWASSNLDPALTWKMEVLEARERGQKSDTPHASARGGSGSSPGREGHGFRRLDLAPEPREGC